MPRTWVLNDLVTSINYHIQSIFKQKQNIFTIMNLRTQKFIISACCWSLRSLNHFHEPSDLLLTWESFPDPYNPKWTQVCKQPPVRIKGNTLDKSIIHLIPSHVSLPLVYIYLPMQHSLLSSYIFNEKSFKWFLFRAYPIILYIFLYILL